MNNGVQGEPGTEVERSTADSLLLVPRLIGGALADIRTIAEGMSMLPKLLTALNSIDARVQTLDEEVRLMRASVESMGGDVSEVRAGIDRVEPHLEDVTRVVHPFRTIRGRRQPRG
jgi:hypothetical protein